MIIPDDFERIDYRCRGGFYGMPDSVVQNIGKRGWNILREDVALPVGVLRQAALVHNQWWMNRCVATAGVLIAPHAKTTMSPQLLSRQLDTGAWGITVATVEQLSVCRRCGVRRIVLANQLIGRQSIHYVLRELRADRQFDFYCLVDSLDGVALLERATRDVPVGRPVQLLLEGGLRGGRSGCRSKEAAMRVATAVRAAEPRLTLRGVAGYEGILGDHEVGSAQVSCFLRFLLEVAAECERKQFFGAGRIILSAGGTAFFDLVRKEFASATRDQNHDVVVRCGSYLLHDHGLYANSVKQLLSRSPEFGSHGAGPRSALELWAYVTSIPEAGLAIVGLGRRDYSVDSGPPTVTSWFRAIEHGRPVAFDEAPLVARIHQHHTCLTVPPRLLLRVGDMVSVGVANAADTFEKWNMLFLVDDNYDVIGAVQTAF